MNHEVRLADLGDCGREPQYSWNIEFRLDRGGAELESQAKSYPAGPAPRDFIFNRPFLLYMKKRDAQEPYLVIWIENDELLQKWAE